MRKMTMKRPLLTASLLLLSCTAQVDTERREGLDETLACPEGRIGYNFQTHPPRSLSTQLKTDNGLLPERRAIEISSVVCGGDAESLESRNETNRVRQTCAGELKCSQALSCTGEVTVTYGCGDVDPNNEGTTRSQTMMLAAGAGRTLTLDCSPPPEPPEMLPERSACVPRHCPGKSRRDEGLNCVPDATIPTVRRPIFERNNVAPLRSDPVQPNIFQMGADYYFSGMLYYRGTEDTVVPEDARVTVWLADRFAATGQHDRYAFRCVFTTLDAGRARIERDRFPQRPPRGRLHAGNGGDAGQLLSPRRSRGPAGRQSAGGGRAATALQPRAQLDRQ